MNSRRAPSIRMILLLVFLAIWCATCIAPPYPTDLLLQHVLTALFVGLVVVMAKRWPLSNLSYLLIFLFMVVHVIGARWLYSNVPYEVWAEHVFGVTFQDAFALSDRNHYDRFTHLCFGALSAYPVYELCRRYGRVSHGWSCLIALQFCLAVSAAYELMEWLAAIILAPEMAERYNGQQGDIWDAHKDMAHAVFGALIALGVIALAARTRVYESK